MKSDVTTLQKRLLGEILVSRSIITKQELEQALKAQKKEDKYIGEILINLGYAKEMDIVIALVVQYNLPYIAIDRYDIDKNILSLISKEFACKNKLIPLDRVGNVLSVVMVDPLNEEIKSQLHELTHCRIAPFIATEAEILNAVNRYY